MSVGHGGPGRFWPGPGAGPVTDAGPAGGAAQAVSAAMRAADRARGLSGAGAAWDWGKYMQH